MACFCLRKFCTFTVLQSIGLIVIYYSFSIGLTFYQKWFINDYFHFPLTVVICHLVTKFIFAVIVRTVWECYTKKRRIILPWNIYIKRLSIIGATSALDIGFSNWSFEFITLSLYTMTKSTAVIFILIFAILFGLEKIAIMLFILLSFQKCTLIIVVLLISTGLFLFTFQSTQFNVNGFLLVLSATVSSGVRWTLAQLIMQKKELGLHNPVDMIYHIQPWMILGLLPIAIAIEGLPLVTSAKLFRFEDITVPLKTITFIFFGSVLAFLMETIEFLLLFFTSSLSLSIVGIFKEMCTIFLAWQYHGDSINTINFIGLVISLVGISLHVGLKAYSAKASVEKHGENMEMPLLTEYFITDEDEDTLFHAQEFKKHTSKRKS
uniref:Sugar phosphate transporter domain-containing protein n=1 Tax=Strigamia maritima TaxID=126957 RepID=T1J562_STRMM